MRIEDKDKIFITPAFLSDIVYLFIYCLLLVRLCSNISNVSLALTQTLMRPSGKCEDILAYKKSLRLLIANFFQVSRAKTGLDFIGGANHFILPKFCIEIMTLLQCDTSSSLINNNKCIPFIPSMPVDRDKTSKYQIKLDIILEGNTGFVDSKIRLSDSEGS